jgi:putative transcriptional regulator
MEITMKAARVNAGLTQQQAANALNISKNTLARYEKGKAVPLVTMAHDMATLYGISVNDIIFLPTDCT